MKTKLTEFDGCFEIQIEAENMDEAAALVRFGMNRTQIRTCDASVFKGGDFKASVVFGKRKRGYCTVPKRK